MEWTQSILLHSSSRVNGRAGGSCYALEVSRELLRLAGIELLRSTVSSCCVWLAGWLDLVVCGHVAKH
uniref:Uncharacterized protein n=1 Tax=Physcomitrium patens TaxID=3218 RepID=A0A7I4EDY0_PHYPA